MDAPPEPVIGSRWRARAVSHRGNVALVERLRGDQVVFRLVISSRRGRRRHSLPLEKWRARYEPVPSEYEVAAPAYRRVRKEQE